MKPESIVENLIDEPYGPPIPDKWQSAVGHMRHLRDLHRKADDNMRELDKALQFERQLKKHGLEKTDVSHYIKQGQRYPSTTPSGFPLPARMRSSIPDDAIIGIETNDGREIIFDFPIIVP